MKMTKEELIHIRSVLLGASALNAAMVGVDVILGINAIIERRHFSIFLLVIACVFLISGDIKGTRKIFSGLNNNAYHYFYQSIVTSFALIQFINMTYHFSWYYVVPAFILTYLIIIKLFIKYVKSYTIENLFSLKKS